MNADQIAESFVSKCTTAGKKKGFDCQYWSENGKGITKNILKVTGKQNCLIYFKVRSEKPYRWGVTANRLNILKRSGIRWFLVLLYESSNSGYLIADKEIECYISIWPLGRDGDYKVMPGSYLRFNKPFSSFSEFVNCLFENLNQ